MEWFKKHADAVVTISLMFAGFLWMNSKFNELEKDMAVMKAVLIVKQIMPSELATKAVK
jgi:low temperature requirement protein LtrA